MADLEFKTRSAVSFLPYQVTSFANANPLQAIKGHYFDEYQFRISGSGILTDLICLFISGFLQKSSRTVIWDCFLVELCLSTATFNSLLSSKYFVSPDSFPGMVVWRTWSIVTVHNNIPGFFIDA